MARVTKSLTAKESIKKYLVMPRVIMVQEADFIKLLNNQILKRFSMLLGIEKIRKEISGPCGYQGLMQRSMNQVSHIRILLTHCQKKI